MGIVVTDKQISNQPSTSVLRKGVLKICSEFTGEHPCQSVISIKSDFVLPHGCSIVPETWSATEFFWRFEPYFAISLFKSGKLKFWKNEKNAWWYHHLHLCTTNDNHIINGSRDMKHDRQNFGAFWVFFALLTH